MKKNAIVLLLVLLLAATVVPRSYAVNIVDTLTCKKVVLLAGHKTILVNRMTGNVKYVRLGKRWVPVTGALKVRYQALYNIQDASKKHRLLPRNSNLDGAGQ